MIRMTAVDNAAAAAAGGNADTTDHAVCYAISFGVDYD